MYLKSLKLTGFKSFADRTRLEFRPGVTVVVGPNGSGKSNVVDAIAWVMGTQSPKALRTSKMDDVIFAGTATRPGLGRAEVTLAFDNSSGMLPLDLPEVSVTRRLYRDGSSDYEINWVGCRLLDIQEPLSDSGVGRHQHVIIGQGQITSIL
ncbi:MAG: AAA family ATPase, partial [Acidimicrobiia bacterium]